MNTKCPEITIIIFFDKKRLAHKEETIRRLSQPTINIEFLPCSLSSAHENHSQDIPSIINEKIFTNQFDQALAQAKGRFLLLVGPGTYLSNSIIDGISKACITGNYEVLRCRHSLKQPTRRNDTSELSCQPTSPISLIKYFLESIEIPEFHTPDLFCIKTQFLKDNILPCKSSSTNGGIPFIFECLCHARLVGKMSFHDSKAPKASIQQVPATSKQMLKTLFNFYKSLSISHIFSPDTDTDTENILLENLIADKIDFLLNNSISSGYNPSNKRINGICHYYKSLSEDITGSKLNKTRKPMLVVSLTTIPQRISNVSITIESIFQQTLVPDKVILYLDRDNFKQTELPSSLLKQIQRGLTVKYCDNIKSYKKLIYALQDYPNSVIITADDDTIYPPNWLKTLYDSYKGEPSAIHCHRAHWIKNNDGHISSYIDWPIDIDYSQSSFNIFPTGCNGILYPPRILSKEVSNIKNFMQLAPTADDIWFKCMSLLNTKKCVVTNNKITKSSGNFLTGIWTIPGSQETSLKTINADICSCSNDQQFANIINHYNLEKLLRSELNNESVSKLFPGHLTKKKYILRNRILTRILKEIWRVIFRIFNRVKIISRYGIID